MSCHRNKEMRMVFWLSSLIAMILLTVIFNNHKAFAEVNIKLEGPDNDKVLSGDCSLYELHKKPKPITRDNKYGLWPGLMSESDLESGEMLFGMEEAMEMIYRNQNPPDCQKANYIILDGWMQGYGSEIHIYGVGLAVALDMGYVVLQKGGWMWRFNNKFCESQGQKTLDCYYVPWSRCSIRDAIHVIYPDGPDAFKKKQQAANDQWTAADDNLLFTLVKKHGNKGAWIAIAENFPTKTSLQCALRWRNVVKKRLDASAAQGTPLKNLIHKELRTIADFITHKEGIYPLNRVLHGRIENGRAVLLPNHTDRFANTVMVVGEEVYFKYEKFVPKMFVPMLKCTKMHNDAYYLWWRAIAATFMIRPNNATLDLLEKERDPFLQQVGGKCISTYVRHGDKGIEMQLVPTKKYLDAAMKVWNEGLSPVLKSSKQRVFYISSDDYLAINTAHTWGAKNGIAIRQSNMSRTILSDRRQVIKQHDMERNFPKSREMEYFSYILHLADTVYCETCICTWPSNYCRLIDELRTTVGGKANKIFIDLSVETCKKQPPCIRHNGLGNYVGEIYDPKDRLW